MWKAVTVPASRFMTLDVITISGMPAGATERNAVLNPRPVESESARAPANAAPIISKVTGVNANSILTRNTRPKVTHLVMGSGAGDPEKWDPTTSRETLDHSAMYVFAVALQDGDWHHDASYASDRARRPDTLALWKKVRTVSDPFWTREFEDPLSLDKAHGARVVVTLEDGSTIEDELRVANSHPRGNAPWKFDDYCKKLLSLSSDYVSASEASRFLDTAASLSNGRDSNPVDLSIDAGFGLERMSEQGLFR